MARMGATFRRSHGRRSYSGRSDRAKRDGMGSRGGRGRASAWRKTCRRRPAAGRGLRRLAGRRRCARARGPAGLGKVPVVGCTAAGVVGARQPRGPAGDGRARALRRLVRSSASASPPTCTSTRSGAAGRRSNVRRRRWARPARRSIRCVTSRSRSSTDRCRHEEPFCIGSAAAAPQIRFVGGGASTALDARGANPLGRTAVFANGEALSDAGIAVVLETSRRFEVITSNHLVATGIKTVVTAGAGRRIDELDGVPARAAPRRAPRPDRASSSTRPPATSYTFARFIDGTAYVRTIHSIEADRIEVRARGRSRRRAADRCDRGIWSRRPSATSRRRTSGSAQIDRAARVLVCPSQLGGAERGIGDARSPRSSMRTRPPDSRPSASRPGCCSSTTRSPGWRSEVRDERRQAGRQAGRQVGQQAEGRAHQRARGRARGGAAHDRRPDRPARAQRDHARRPRPSCSTRRCGSATCSRSARARSRPRAPSSARCARTSIRSSASAPARSPSPRPSCARRTSSSSARAGAKHRVHLDRRARAAHAADQHRRLPRSVLRGSVRRAAASSPSARWARSGVTRTA